MNKKIAFVYDWMDKWGGVERLLLVLHDLFPSAPFFTSYYNPSLSWFKNIVIIPSFMQKLPIFIRNNRILSLFFFPYAFESFDFSAYDIVISISSSFAKSIITKPSTKHINIMLTPTRFLTTHENLYIPVPIKKMFLRYINDLKKWDKIASQRPDSIISISKHIQKKCEQYYNQKSIVIYPPFDIDYWNNIKRNIKITPPSKKPYYLIVSRLEPYKRIDLAIHVINKNPNIRLIIIGSGTLERKLKQMSSDNINFIKSCSDEELATYYSYADALIMPQDEDFGYVSLEAQFFGCPVISYKESGGAETIIDGKTGILFNEQTYDSFFEALEKYQSLSYTIKTHVKNLKLEYLSPFSKTTFIKKLISFIDNS